MKRKLTKYTLIKAFIGLMLLLSIQTLLYKSKVSDYSKSLMVVSQNVSNALRDIIYDFYGEITLFSRELNDYDNLDKERFSSIANKYIKNNPNIEYIISTDENIKIRNYKIVNEYRDEIQFIQKEEIRIKGKPKIMDISMDYLAKGTKQEHKDIISIRTPVFDKEGVFNGIVVIGLDLNKLIKEIVSKGVVSDYKYKFTDSGDHIIYSNSKIADPMFSYKQKINLEDIVWGMEVNDDKAFKKDLFISMSFIFLIFVIILIMLLRFERKLFNKDRHIQELERLQLKVSEIAYTDALTGLPNRRKITKIMRDILSSTKTLKKHGVVFLDLDNFKNVNDSLGHSCGDKLLISVVERLNTLIDDNILVSRIGGDEFLFLLKDVKGREEVEDLCKRALEVISKPFLIGSKEINTTVSIGACLYPDNGLDMTELFKNADTAMYSAKAKGKSRYEFFNDDMMKKLERKIEIEDELRRAIEQNELTVFYQPQLDLVKKDFSNMEALLRWNSKKLGFVSPGEFIIVAEETGMIREIGDWVIKEVCRQLTKWDKDGLWFESIAINISPVQFASEDFAKNIKKHLDICGIDPGRITLEITEQVFMKDYEACINTITELSDMGFTISLDDFGTGYSSLSYLANLPIDILKIDKSFVDNIISDNYSLSLLEGIIQLAHLIGMDVIAEGVESESQLSLLTHLKSDLIQGYLYSRPMHGDDVEGFVKEKMKER